MLIKLTRLLSFVAGVFVVWFVGRKHYYDEEKLIDFVVFTSVVGVVSWWLAGYVGLVVQDGGLSGWRLLAVTFAVIAFAVYYLHRIHWPFWPPLGFLWLGVSMVWMLIRLADLLYGSQSVDSGLVFATLTFLSALYIVALGGERNLKDLARGVKVGYQKVVMSTEQTQQKLEEEARRIERQITKLEEESELVNQTRGIENTLNEDVHEAEEGSRIMTIVAMLTRRLREIRVALHKIRDRSYGICDRCGEKISVRRLEAVPDARYCLKCEQKMERELG